MIVEDANDKLKRLSAFSLCKIFSFDLGVKYDISMRFTLKRPTKIKKELDIHDYIYHILKKDNKNVTKLSIH